MFSIVDECVKNKLKKLRTQFSRCNNATKKNRMKSGSEAVEETKWAFLNSLAFLVPHTNPRRSVSNFVDLSEQEVSILRCSIINVLYNTQRTYTRNLSLRTFYIVNAFTYLALVSMNLLLAWRHTCTGYT